MTTKKKIEVFSAGCATCKETIELVKRIAGSSHEVVIHDMHQSETASKAKNYGVRSAPLWSLTPTSQAAVLAAVRMSMSCVLPSDRRESFACRCEQEVARVSRRPGIRGFSVSERAAQLRLKARNQLFKRRLVARLLSFQKLLQLVAVKAHNNLSVNHGDRDRHVTKLL